MNQELGGVIKKRTANLRKIFYGPSQAGQVVITAVILFLMIAVTIGIGVTNPVLRQVKQSDDFNRTRASLFVAQSVNEDALYRLINGRQFVSPSTLSLNGYTATATTSSVTGGIQINSSGNGFNLIRNVQTHLTTGDGATFHYGVQVGDGGVEFENSSSVRGNLYANGPIDGSGNVVYGDIVSAGPTGSITSMHATGTLYAHNLSNSTADKDAYYKVIDSYTTNHVAGVKYPNSTDQATTSMPISEALIAEWESDAVTGGGTATCDGQTYVIDNDTTIGPKKIPCDLEISGSTTVTINGPIWVTGNINFNNSAQVKISSSLSGKTVPIIADKTTNRSSSSKITLSNSTEFVGYGSNSYIILVSMNNNAESGGETKAINASNSASGDVLLYAPHGSVEVANSISVREITAYKLEMKNSATVVYKSGLANLLFTSGPAGGYVFDAWREVQ